MSEGLGYKRAPLGKKLLGGLERKQERGRERKIDKARKRRKGERGREKETERRREIKLAKVSYIYTCLLCTWSLVFMCSVRSSVSRSKRVSKRVRERDSSMVILCVSRNV